MFERQHGKAQRIRQLLETFPDEDVFLASDMGNGETRPVPIETDERGQIMLPNMQGETPGELPSLPATAEGW